MPVLFVVASVVMQAGAEGYLSGRVDVWSSLLLSCIAFATAAAVFTALRLAGRPASRPAGSHDRRRVRVLLAGMNVATAVTFLGMFVSLAWVPSTLASCVLAGVGPLSACALAAVGLMPKPTSASWVGASVLLALALAVAVSLSGAGHGVGRTVLGTGLAALAGISATVIAVLSGRLAHAGANPVQVTSHRFHLTYLLAAALLLGHGHISTATLSPQAFAVLTVFGIVVPLYLLQCGLHRVRPTTVMAVLAPLPGLTYVSSVVFGATFRPEVGALVAALVLGAAGYVVLDRPPPSAQRVDSDLPPAGSPVTTP